MIGNGLKFKIGFFLKKNPLSKKRVKKHEWKSIIE